VSRDEAYRALLEVVNRGIEGVDVASALGGAAAREEAPAGAAGEGRGGTGTRLFITGVPRSGTTLLYQLLCASGALGWVSNVAARFYRNPAFGAGVQELLRPLLPDPVPVFTSEYGRTGSWAAPHEFGFYWSRHLPFHDSHQPTAEELEEVDWTEMDTELAGLSAVLGRPLVFKNNILACVTPALGVHLPDSLFLELRRDPADVAHSILRARRAEAGGESAWWSTRVRGWRALQERLPVEQIVEQMARIDAAHDRARSALGATRWRAVSYEELCRDPRGTVGAALSWAGTLGGAELERLPARFEPSRPRPEPALAGLAALLAERGVRQGERRADEGPPEPRSG
jgi:hypothetical protein